ncbi:MAG: prepilin-type N-terminal cleavage/methylation domain-containing protein [Acidobacteriota bacterium]
MVRIKRRSRASAAGFTLIELIVVVTIIGMLAAIAVVNVRNAQRRAAENILKADLANIRKAIDDFYADKQRYPSSLQELVDEKYMRRLPVDPITKSSDTWDTVQSETSTDDSGGFGSSPDFGAGGALTPTGPGIEDVKSGAEGSTLDGVPYTEL